MEKENPELQVAYERLQEILQKRKQKSVAGKIVNVRLGELGSFIPAQKLRNPERAGKQAICLEIATPDGYSIRRAMILSAHPNSAIMRFLNKYGDWPKVGMEVRLKFDETSGFWRLEL
jgi:hypothetical protein